MQKRLTRVLNTTEMQKLVKVSEWFVDYTRLDDGVGPGMSLSLYSLMRFVSASCLITLIPPMPMSASQRQHAIAPGPHTVNRGYWLVFRLAGFNLVSELLYCPVLEGLHFGELMCRERVVKGLRKCKLDGIALDGCCELIF